MGPEQFREGAAFFIANQSLFLQEVETLEEKYYERREELESELGSRRLREYRAALGWPETKAWQRLRKQRFFAENQFIDPIKAQNPTDDYTREIGARVYEQRTINTTRLYELETEVPGVGRVEPKSTAGGYIFPKMVHYKTGASVAVIYDEAIAESEAFKQWVARVNMKANLGQGRPLVVVLKKRADVDVGGGGAVRYRYYSVPQPKSERRATRFRANYVAPDKGAAVLTGMSVLFSAALTEGKEAVQHYLNHSYVVNHNPTYASIAFGTVFGLWASFYNNMTAADNQKDPASVQSAILRRMLISSITFSYSMVVLDMVTHHNLTAISVMTSGFWLLHGKKWLLGYVNNLVKERFRQPNEIREELGLSRGKIRLFGVEVKRNQFERQAWYMMPFFLNILAQTEVKVGDFPFGEFAFYSSLVWMPYLTYRYATYLDSPSEGFYAQRWKSIWPGIYEYASAGVKSLFSNPKQWLEDVKSMLREDWSFCSRVFLGKKKRSFDSDEALQKAGFIADPGGWYELPRAQNQ